MGQAATPAALEEEGQLKHEAWHESKIHESLFFQKHSAQCLDLSKRTTGAHDWIRQATDVGSCYPFSGLPPHQVNQVNNTALFENAEAGCAIFGLLQRRDDGEVKSVIPVFDGDLMVKSLSWNLFDVAPAVLRGLS